MADKYPIFFQGSHLVLSKSERELIDYLIETGDLTAASKKAGMEESAAKDFLAGPRVKLYLQHKVSQVARRNDITLDTVLDRLHKVAFGEIKVDRFEMDALKTLAHYLGIIKPHQTNIAVGVKVDNGDPLKELSDEDLEAMVLQRNEKKQIGKEGE